MKHLNELDWARLSSGARLSSLRSRWHLRTCQRCGERHRALLQEREAFFQDPDAKAALGALLAQVPASALQRKVVPSSSRTSAQRAVWGLSLAGCALLLLVVAGRLAGPSTPDEQLRPKGSIAWSLHIQREGRAGTFFDGQCRPGDVVRGQYRSDGGYLLVFGVDAQGLVQQLYPEAPGSLSAPVTAGRHLLPDGWKLDDSEGAQRFIAVFSRSPLSLAELERRLGPSFTDISGLPADTTVRVVECNVRR